MFNNLIESSSHRSEFKRRGSFFLFTTATYVLLFVISGVISIYAYDARLEYQNTEIVTMLNPVELELPRVEAVRPPNAHPSGNNHEPGNFVRRNPIASVNDPRIAPEVISAKPNLGPPLPPRAHYVIGDHDADPGVGPGNSRVGGVGENSGGGTPPIEVGTPPPPQIEKPKPLTIHKRILNGEAISLPKPPYPPLAKQMRIQGSVSVQVLIDENGKVVSAKAVSGNVFLVPAAQKAAFDARFSPTLLGEQRVKVSGVITYNFVLQ